MRKLEKFALVSMFHSDYEEIFNEMYYRIKAKEQQYMLNVNRVMVTSSFENRMISTRFGIDIGLRDTILQVPTILYNGISEKLNANKVNGNILVQLGYGMRCFNISSSGITGSITTGSHCAINNTISFDAKIYNLLGEQAMIHRFGHEMMHEFGYTEDMVLEKEDSFYLDIKDLCEEFILLLYERIPTAEDNLIERIDAIFATGSTEEGILNHLYEFVITNQLSGCDGQVEITVEHPITKRQQKILFF